MLVVAVYIKQTHNKRENDGYIIDWFNKPDKQAHYLMHPIYVYSCYYFIIKSLVQLTLLPA